MHVIMALPDEQWANNEKEVLTMLVKVIARYDIIMPNRVATDDDLRALDGIFESEPFEINPALSLSEKLEYAYSIMEPILPRAYCDTLELVEL